MRNFLKNSFGELQKIGRALMLPVALLPAAGLLVGIGQIFNNPEAMVNSYWLHMFANIISSAGNIIFDNLPILFATGVAIGLSDGDGVAGLSAVVGFLVLNMTMGTYMGLTPEIVRGNPNFDMVLGIPTLQMGVMGGIIIGVVTSIIYKKFYRIRLPECLGFFSGKRFVPIMTSIVSLFLGLILVWTWPRIQELLLIISRSLIGTNQNISSFIFGVVERALVPFGLHHIWYNPFWYQFGEYINSSGQLIIGDQAIFFEQLKDNVALTAGTFMTGKFPIMMFGLPGAALAMYHEAFDENKKRVSALLLSAALASFLTGITEPIEFSFLFLAPILFAIHCVFAGFSFMIMNLLNVKIGMTFSGGLIDFLFLGVLPNKTPWYLVIVVGLILFIIYYLGFRFVIRKLNLQTPGREHEELEAINEFEVEIDLNGEELAKNVLKALGGKNNIKYLDACITRLRITVKDLRKVQKIKLKQLGVAGIMVVGNNIQAIFGPQSDILKDQIKDIIAGKEVKLPKSSKKAIPIIKKGENTGKQIYIPIGGNITALENTPDDIFSMKLIGDGFAIEPTENILTSPVEGKVEFISPNNHAITIKSNDGLEVFMHIGIDSMKMKGNGFNPLVKVGDIVNVNDNLIEFSMELLKKEAKSTMIPVIFKNLSRTEFIYFEPNKTVKKGMNNEVEVHKRQEKISTSTSDRIEIFE
ncbi:glucose-specific PTS transporter subunit IIBC [Clostridioides difficile]